jgi:hypothetical protein
MAEKAPATCRKGRSTKQRAAGVQVDGLGVMGIGSIVVAFGSPWQKASEEFTSAYAFSEWLELYLSYWPFEPFIPLFVILLGVSLATKSRARTRIGSRG